MVLHRPPAPAPTPGSRTGGSWRSWRAAWTEAAYGPDGFWSTQRPGGHFSTGVGVGPLVAEAVAGVVPKGGRVVVDVGAGDGHLLSHLVHRLPDVALVGVDRRARPPGLDPRVAWVEDHHDVDTGRWVVGPDGWTEGAAPLLVAHEWLDDLPVAVVERSADDWREVEVDDDGHERVGPAPAADDRAWLARWWPEGRRAEVGRARDVAWAALVRSAVRRGGRALAVDYGHEAGSRPADGTFLAYGAGRQRAAVPDGRVNLTAGVAVDALGAAGEATGAATLLLRPQAKVLTAVPDAPADALGALVRRSERAALTALDRWGDLWWLLQGSPT
ncbi:SAM-dependent methyltransferase [Microlunatus antarcticus]|uniref:SAM-dependent MidA family methyltransferase n=1 Tax=Microlunatus antarcticus TaxID=53388 RepID=A0A7W5JSB6_9ACTN|nr:SAM-dependent methyltransferase [Microlunatus antarcticus]MBB3325345.1 SAM-dependent MidA family methyltransferase [Microlunatus antarcticus]